LLAFIRNFDPDEAELTRSRKLKRSVVNKKYEEIYKAMYEDQETVNMEATVAYSDGRQGKVKATLRIMNV